MQASIGGSTDVRRRASPITYVSPGAAPFLILHGTAETMVPPRPTAALAQRLAAAGVPATRVAVQGAEHSLTTPEEQPSPAELTATIVDFFTTSTRGTNAR